jgi:hypothetical protein
MDNASHISTGSLRLGPAGGLLNCQQFPGFFSATVCGVDEDGTEFEADVPLDGHLDDDLYLRLSRSVKPRSELFIVLRFTLPLVEASPLVRMALHGRVKRVNPLLNGKYDLRVSILDYRPL